MQMVVDKEGLKNFAYKIAAKLKGGEIFVLIGDLAAGKTFFTQKLGEYLGAKKIKSPTFNILQIHKTNKLFSLAHFDFYRLRDAEIDFFEWSDYLGKKEYVSLIEWGEKIKPKLSNEDFYEIRFDFVDNAEKRKLVLSNNLEKWLKN